MSKASESMTDNDLIELLNESRDWNISHRITGMLLYVRSSLLNHQNGRFIQALEGEKIKVDRRHYNVLLLNQFNILKRAFPNWTMGFETLDTMEFANLPGAFNLDDAFLQKEQMDYYTPVLNILKSFYDLNKTFGK
jgi:hypothetical protein